ncbi:MAG: hypothetical protein ACI93R_003298 [Flavobacteriales bacterium]|jgi:hypothetical protein
MRNHIFVILLLIISVPAFAGDKLYEEVPAEELFSSTTYYGFKFSPNGDKLLFRYWTPETILLITYDLSKRTIINQVALPRNAVDIDWVTNGQIAFSQYGFLQKMEEGSLKSSTMISRKIEGGKNREDKQNKYWKIEHNLPDDPENVLVSSDNGDYQNLHKFNTVTGEKEDLTDSWKDKLTRWKYDDLGVPRLAIKQDKSILQYYFKPKSESTTVLPVILPNGDQYSVNLLDRRNRGYRFEGYIVDSNNLIFSELNDDGVFDLIVIRPVDGKRIKTLPNDANISLSALDVSVRITTNSKDRRLAGYTFYSKRWNNVWSDAKYQDIQNSIDRLNGNRENVISKCNAALSYCLIDSYGKSGNYEKLLYDVKKIDSFLVYSKHEQLLEYHINQAQQAEYLNRDGYLVRGWETLPALHTDKGEDIAGVVIIPCPDYFSMHTNKYDGIREFFTSRGFATFELNTQGCIGRNKNHLWGNQDIPIKSMASDIVDASKWLQTVDRYKNLKAKVFSTGDIGSIAALLAAKESPKSFSGLALFSVPLDLNSYVKWAKKLDAYNALSYWKNKENKIPNLKPLSLLNYIENIDIPVLLAYGADDDGPVANKLKKIKVKKNKNIRIKELKDINRSLNVDSAKIFFLESSLDIFHR